MKKPSTQEPEMKQAESLAAVLATRRACNQLTHEERRQLLEDGLRIIHGSDAKATPRSH